VPSTRSDSLNDDLREPGFRPVDDEILPRICVRPPYFALEDLRASSAPGSEVTARVRVEQPLGRELGPISAAEVGRHMAILGSCAAALAQPSPGRHYYLANVATLRNVMTGPETTTAARPLRGYARAQLVDKRRAEAQTRIVTAEGAPLYQLDVGYHVIAEKLFTRLHAPARRELRTGERGGEIPSEDQLAVLRRARANPYSSIVLPELAALSADAISSVPRAVRAEECNGHFAMYPALPVAVVMYALIHQAGRLLAHRSGDDALAFTVKHARAEAVTLAWAGDMITFAAQHVGAQASTHRFTGQALVDGHRSVGTIELELAVARA